MKNGIAMWHYHHRTVIENVEFFGSHGLEALSLHQKHMLECIRGGQGAELAALTRYGVTLSVHGLLLNSHSDADRGIFETLKYWEGLIG